MVHRIQILGIVLLAAAVAGFHAGGQNRLEGWDAAMIDGRLLEGRWPAHWISVQDMSENEYTVCHFRKTFELGAAPENFIVHVSADNRYKLYVNCLNMPYNMAFDFTENEAYSYTNDNNEHIDCIRSYVTFRYVPLNTNPTAQESSADAESKTETKVEAKVSNPFEG